MPTPIVAPAQTFDYHQGSDQRWNVKKITSNGACQGLSIFWVINKAKGVDYLTWLGPPPNASAQGSNPPRMGKEMDDVIRVMEQQSKILKLPNGSRKLNMHWARDRIAALPSGSGGSTSLTASGALALLQSPRPQQIAAEIVRVDGYVFLGFFGAIGENGSSGGHGVAAYVQKPTVDFFDPNLGEFRFQNVQSFSTWFTQTLMSQIYGVQVLVTAEIQHFA